VSMRRFNDSCRPRPVSLDEIHLDVVGHSHQRLELRLPGKIVQRDSVSHEAARDEVFNAFSADSRAAARTSTPEMNNLAASGEES